MGVAGAGEGDAAVAAVAETLALAGAADEAAQIVARWTAGDMRLARAPGGGADLLRAARLAYALGRLPLATSLADRAARAYADSSDSAGWAAAPWAYPPAYPELFAAGGDPAAPLEPALLWAVARQESRFDPQARSVSDALGLMQLKLATAGDVAQWLRARAPTEPTLFDPATSVRYGTRYLRRLLQRFDGDTAVALAAYNAGPGTIPPWWREVVARGGDALFCEIGPLPDAQDYAKKILGFRQAYRELRPAASR
jgi:soluble lytic murein transglycosylase-like protein